MTNKDLMEQAIHLYNNCMIGTQALEAYYRTKDKPKTYGYKPEGPGAYLESTYEALARELTYEDIEKILEIKKRKEKFDPDKRI